MRNALKLTYSNLEFQKNIRGREGARDGREMKDGEAHPQTKIYYYTAAAY